jgi:hypothetical protein
VKPTPDPRRPPRPKHPLGLERRHQPLLPARQFRSRLISYSALAGSLIGVSLGIGMIGYRIFAGLSWIDALLNASMILTGMGPVNPMTTVGAKLFASAYAIFSGVAFLTSFGVLAAPMFHRFLHRFHLEVANEDEDS